MFFLKNNSKENNMKKEYSNGFARALGMVYPKTFFINSFTMGFTMMTQR